MWRRLYFLFASVAKADIVHTQLRMFSVFFFRFHQRRSEPYVRPSLWSANTRLIDAPTSLFSLSGDVDVGGWS